MFDLPFWVGVVLMTFGLPLAAELGFRAFGPLQRRASNGHGPADAKATGQAMTRAVALLSLMLAFTLSSAAARYEARRTTIAQEADQISTTYLRVQLLGEPARSRMSVLLDRYAHDREAMIRAFDNRTDRGRLAKVVAADQRQLWAALTHSRQQPDSDQLKTKLLESTNAMLSSARFTYAAMEAKTAPLIIVLLVIFSFWIAFMSGYELGAIGKRYPWLSTTILIMFGWTMLVVNDLDHPGKGFIENGTAPFQRALEWIDAPAGEQPGGTNAHYGPQTPDATVSSPPGPSGLPNGSSAPPAAGRP